MDTGRSNVSIEPEQMTWPSVEARRLSCRRLNMHAQATYVAEQAWILYKLCSVGKNKPRRKSNEATKSGEKCIWDLGSPQGWS